MAKEQMSKSTDIRIIDLPRIEDPRGNLSFLQYPDQVPFEIERAYWVYDVPGGAERQGHAFRRQHEFIIALSGSFDVVLNRGGGVVRHHLSRSYYGVYVPPMTWRSLDNFSTNSVALVLSSTEYDPTDYIEDYDDFVRLVNIVNN
ncbi:MAG: FdtA/QdtA family cupin domain-containing protein [Muribaculum sp.]|nr:FdtA/QdtA family cupin domain-containing protein [Muribaculum sp.]